MESIRTFHKAHTHPPVEFLSCLFNLKTEMIISIEFYRGKGSETV